METEDGGANVFTPAAPLDRVNEWLDALPRVRFARFARPAPAFRTCGVAGYYVAVLVTVGLGLARGHDLAVLAALCAVCGASFYAYAIARKWATRRETLVLLEHVWFALACAAGALVVMREPVAPYLDDVVCGLAVFLAFGRLGCFLVGCCHGLPSTCGVRYGRAHARDGLAKELVGVRLFPVPLVEAGGLASLAVAGSGLALFTAPGNALELFLLGYAVLRFGLEGVRGDRRPALLGLSQARWMAAAQGAAALWLAERAGVHGVALEILGATVGAALFAKVARGAFGLRARALRNGHLRALRDAARVAEGGVPVASQAPLGFTIAVSHGGRVISASTPSAVRDVPLLCDVVCAAFPEIDIASASMTDTGVLVAEIPGGLRPTRPPAHDGAAYRLFFRLAQRERAERSP